MRKLLTVSTLALLAVAVVAPAHAETGTKKAGDIVVRARGLVVAPSSGGEVLDRATEAPTGLRVTDIDTTVVPELDFTYFFTNNIAAELIAATTPHNVKAGSTKVGKAWLLPPTLTLQYHFLTQEKISPYVGAGINYTMFYGEGDGLPGFKVKNSFGAALQAGVDYQLEGNWSLNLDVKKLYLRPEATTSTLKVKNVKIDPWIIGVGVGYRF